MWSLIHLGSGQCKSQHSFPCSEVGKAPEGLAGVGFQVPDDSPLGNRGSAVVLTFQVGGLHHGRHVLRAQEMALQWTPSGDRVLALPIFSLPPTPKE